jgi:hypothetical protein
VKKNLATFRYSDQKVIPLYATDAVQGSYPLATSLPDRRLGAFAVKRSIDVVRAGGDRSGFAVLRPHRRAHQAHLKGLRVRPGPRRQDGEPSGSTSFDHGRGQQRQRAPTSRRAITGRLMHEPAADSKRVFKISTIRA